MTFEEMIGYKDIVEITIYDLDGNPIEFVVLKNKITTAMLNLLRDMLRATEAGVSDMEIKYLAWTWPMVVI